MTAAGPALGWRQFTPGYRHTLWIVVTLNLEYGIIEAVAGFIRHSQALKADALDFVGDFVPMAIATGAGTEVQLPLASSSAASSLPLSSRSYCCRYSTNGWRSAEVESPQTRFPSKQQTHQGYDDITAQLRFSAAYRRLAGATA